MSFLNKLKNTATSLQQKALVKMGKSEEFKETEEFTSSVATFKRLRLGYTDLVKSGSDMIEKQSAASQDKLAFLALVSQFAQKDGTLPPEVLKIVDALTGYEKYNVEFNSSIVRTVVLPQDDFVNNEIKITRDKKNDLADLRTLRDAAIREKNDTGLTQLKQAKADNEYKQVDDRYQKQRAELINRLSHSDKRVKYDLTLSLADWFEEMYKFHATAYSDMATLEGEVSAFNKRLQSGPVPPLPASYLHSSSSAPESAKDDD